MNANLKTKKLIRNHKIFRAVHSAEKAHKNLSKWIFKKIYALGFYFGSLKLYIFSIGSFYSFIYVSCSLHWTDPSVMKIS